MTIEEDSAWVDALAGRVDSVRAESSDPVREASLLREHLLAQEFRGVTGVPTIETEWVPRSKQSEIGATFTKIAKPTLQCMFEPSK